MFRELFINKKRINKIMEELNVGVTGYSHQEFDEEKAVKLIKEAYDAIEKEYPNQKISIVCGLTNIGINALAYQEAMRRNWSTQGVASSQAKKYKCFPVNKKIIIGKDWGDESPYFIKHVDVLIRIGGGEQAHRETAKIKELNKPTYEYELKTIDNIQYKKSI
jgi:hypothetical protein